MYVEIFKSLDFKIIKYLYILVKCACTQIWLYKYYTIFKYMHA